MCLPLLDFNTLLLLLPICITHYHPYISKFCYRHYSLQHRLLIIVPSILDYMFRKSYTFMQPIFINHESFMPISLSIIHLSNFLLIFDAIISSNADDFPLLTYPFYTSVDTNVNHYSPIYITRPFKIYYHTPALLIQYLHTPFSLSYICNTFTCLLHPSSFHFLVYHLSPSLHCYLCTHSSPA